MRLRTLIAAGILLNLCAWSVLACSKKPKPQPGPPPEKDYGSVETQLADGERGRSLGEMGLAQSLPTVYFGLNETAPLAESIDAMHALVAQVPTYRACRIEGHTCPLGETAYNAALGYHRAQAVLTYLRAAGVRTGFQVTSYGEERLAAFEPREYWCNRRVVVECTP